MNPFSASSPIPIIEDSERRLAKLRGRLQGIFHELHTIQSVIGVCAEAIANQGSDFDPEVVVLTRSGAKNLRNQLYFLAATSRRIRLRFHRCRITRMVWRKGGGDFQSPSELDQLAER